MSTILRSLILVGFLLFWSSCSPKKSEEKAKIAVSMQSLNEYRVTMVQRTPLAGKGRLAPSQNNPLSGRAMTHVVLNVTVNNQNPIVLHWDACSNESTTGNNEDGQSNCDPESVAAQDVEFNIPDLPVGSNVTIQVLGVLESTEQGLGFVYAENADKTLIDGINEFTLTPTDVLASADLQSLKMADISGRYLSSSGVGPTGRLDTLFQPPSGLNPMVIESNEIVAGWVNFFVIQGIDFVYRVTQEDGSTFFLGGGALTYDSPAITPSDSNTNLLQVVLPNDFHEVRFNNGSLESSETGRSDEESRFGFFGPGAASKSVCYLDSASDFGARSPYSRGFYTTDSPSDPSDSPLVWDPSVDSPTPGFAGRVGGVADSNCTGDEFEDYIAFDIGRFLDRGRDGAAGISVPFQMITSAHGYSTFMDVEFDGTEVKAQWQLLPGVEQELDGIEFFYMAPMSRSEEDVLHRMGRAACQRISSGTLPPYQIIDSSDEDPGSGFLSLFVSQVFTSTGGDDPEPKLMACPYVVSNGQKSFLANFEMETVRNDNHGPGPGGGSKLPKVFQITADPKIGYDICHQIDFELKDEDGNYAGTNGNPFAIDLSATTGVTFHDSHDCTDPAKDITSPLPLPFGNNSIYLNYKVASPAGSSPSVTATISALPEHIADDAESTTHQWDAGTSTTPTNLQLAVDGPNYMAPLECTRVEVQMYDASGRTATAGLIYDSFSEDSDNGQFYEDSRCQTTASSVSATGFNTEVFFMLSGPESPDDSFDITVSANSGSVAGTATVNSGGRPDLNGIRIVREVGGQYFEMFEKVVPDNLTTSTCLPFKVVDFFEPNTVDTGNSGEFNMKVDVGPNAFLVHQDLTCSDAGDSTGDFNFFLSAGIANFSIDISSLPSGQNIRIEINETDGSRLADKNSWLDSGGGGGGPSNRLSIEGPSLVGNNQCHRYELFLKDDSDSPLVAVSDQDITIGVTGGGGTFLDSSCSSPDTTITVGNGNSSQVFYFKDLSANNNNMTATHGAFSDAHKNINVISTTGTPGRWEIYAEDRMEPGQCYQLTVAKLDSVGAPIQEGVGISLPIKTDRAIQFYNSFGDCDSNSSAVTNATIGSGEYFSDPLWYKGSGDLYNTSMAIYNSQLKGEKVFNRPEASDLLALGDNFTCTLNPTSHLIKCFGKNSTADRQLGRNLADGGTIGYGNDSGEMGSLPPIAPSNLAGTPISIAAGDRHWCAIMKDSSVQCLGANESRQGGFTANTGNYFTDSGALVEGLSGAVQLAAGADHTCALTKDGKVYCWGQNVHATFDVVGGADLRKLGSDESAPQIAATQVKRPDGGGPLEGMKKVVSGKDHMCALGHDGQAFCWGANSYGQLGRGNTDMSQLPEEFEKASDERIVEIAAGNEFTCAIVETSGTREIRCTGRHDKGQLGIGGGGGASSPTMAASNNDIHSLVAGGDIACAVIAGATNCWGDNAHGELGADSTTTKTAPHEVADLDPLDGITIGENHACGLKPGGGVFCWGLGSEGQLGRDTNQSWGHNGTNTMATLLVSNNVNTGFGYAMLECPAFYAAVEPHSGFGGKAFCVSRYEMKDDGALAYPAGVLGVAPKTPVSAVHATNVCSGMGTGYALISNNEWMSIARSIEDNSINWDSGTVGTGKVVTGKTNGTGGAVVQPASLNEDDACGGTGATCNAVGTNSARRILHMTNGQKLWDFSGNLNEVVDWNENPAFTKPPAASLCTVNSAFEFDNLPVDGGLCDDTYEFGALFKPAGAYTSTEGMGKLKLGLNVATTANVALRGGGFSSLTAAGPYALEVVDTATSANITASGYRCVYRP